LQIIDPHYEMDEIPQPTSRLIRLFYHMSRRINVSLAARNVIFVIVAGLVLLSVILDLVSTKSLLLYNSVVCMSPKCK
jgi:hypothetical protein